MDSINKFLRSFYFAGRGIVSVIVAERNMRIHLLAAVIVITMGIYFNITTAEWCLALICIGMVMAAEAFNSAIEWLTDLSKPEQHPQAGKIKDAAAGAVLLVSISAAAVGAIIFSKYVYRLIN
jgi:diacylglycerol kinase (ATP)